MGLESALEDLESRIEDLDSAVREQRDETETLIEAIKDLTAALDQANQQPKAVSVTNTFQAKPDDTIHGFKPNDKVIFLGRGVGHEVIGIVEPHGKHVELPSSVPVRREDNGVLDRFPAATTVLHEVWKNSLPPREWYLGEPTGSTVDWNRRVCETANEKGLTVTFSYQKPFTTYSGPEQRTIKVTSWTPADSTFTHSSVGGVEDGTGYRTFRLDRIVGPMKVVQV